MYAFKYVQNIFCIALIIVYEYLCKDTILEHVTGTLKRQI